MIVSGAKKLFAFDNISLEACASSVSTESAWPMSTGGVLAIAIG